MLFLIIFVCLCYLFNRAFSHLLSVFCYSVPQLNCLRMLFFHVIYSLTLGNQTIAFINCDPLMLSMIEHDLVLPVCCTNLHVQSFIVRYFF